MNGVRIPGAWGCLVAFAIGLLLTVPVAGGETVSGNALGERLLRSNSASSEENNAISPWRTASTGKSRTWGLLGSGVGLVAGVGLALWVKSEADDRYDIYLNTADPDVARDALDSAERYDRATLIGWGLAQVSFIAFVYFLTREGERPLISPKGEPLVRPQEDGFQIGFRVSP